MFHYKSILTAIACALLLTGCSGQQNIPAVPTTNISNTITAETSVSEPETCNSILDIKDFSDDNPQLPCKSVHVTADEHGNPVNTLFVTLWNDEVLSFPLPVEDNSCLKLNSVDFADLDGDDEEEIIVSCWYGFYYMSIYMLDTASNSLLPVPYLSDEESLTGVEYEAHNKGCDVLTINNDATGFFEQIDLNKILTDNYNRDKECVSYSEKDYKQEYVNSDSCYVSQWTGRYWLEMYEGQECLILEQPVTGARGKNDILGFIETGINWDEEGNCRLLFSRFSPME